MRLWSLHPKYLDAKGLVALWREALLAKCVLEGKTKGYQSHPQLVRFKRSPRPLAAINYYLRVVFEEASQRGYRFNSRKFNSQGKTPKISVTVGQLAYEHDHLLRKLKRRDKVLFQKLKGLSQTMPHPLFRKVKGTIEPWEKTVVKVLPQK